MFKLGVSATEEYCTIFENPVGGSPNDRSLDFVCVSFSPDGRWLVAGMRNGETVLWNLLAGNRRVKLPAATRDNPKFVRVVEVSPDGQTLAVGSGDTLTVWRLSQDGTSWSKAYDDVKLSAAVWDLTFSPDGKEILLVVGLKDLVRFLTKTGKVKDNRTLNRHTGFILAATFLPDGRLLTGGSNAVVNCWDYDRGDEFFTFAGHTASILSLSVSRDGKTFVSSSDDGSVRIWRASQDGDAR